MSATPITLGVIGLGMASLPHAKSLIALQQAGRIHCKAAWSPSVERRQSFNNRWHLPVVDDVASLINDPDIQIVILIIPPDARAEYVRSLARGGKHILMEKPVERTTQAATALVEIADAADVQLGIVFQQRFRDASLRAREVMLQGGLGTLTSVRVEVPWWREQTYYDKVGRGSLDRDGGGVLISQAIHSLDLMLALTGPVVEVAAMAATTAHHSMECEDFVGAALRFENGATGSLVATTAEYPGATERIVIAGSEGTLYLSGAELTIHYRKGDTESLGADTGSGGGADPMDFPHHWHQRLIEDFLDAIEQGRSPAVTGRDSLRVHQLIDALLDSSHRRRHVMLADQA